jgi:D-glycero-D-manno-heptose 1,7-bisphosphate phosphatase
VSAIPPLRLRTGSSPAGRPSPAVFLDRDGVLNDVAGAGRVALSPRSVADVRIIPGASDAVARLRAAGFLLVVVTNQPDVARGDLSRDDAMAITAAVVDALGLDDAFVCPHDGPDDCDCRKPRPGLLTAASEAWNLDLDRSWLVGDRWVDVAAAAAAGVCAVLLERDYSMHASGGVTPPATVRPDIVSATLDDAVTAILGSLA